MQALCRRDAIYAARALREGAVGVDDLTNWCLSRIDEANTRLRCLAGSSWRDRATAGAQVAAERIRGGQSAPLDGVPITVKDNFCVEGQILTAASEVLGQYRSPFSASAVEALEAAGALIIARTNMDEFGMGSGSIYSRYGAVVNPWSPGEDSTTYLSAGGSSGGAAASVACGAAFAALASDTGGSVRQPASWCGVVGMKPTYGRVSRHGLIAYASTMDTPGVITRTVRDAALLFDILSRTAPDYRDDRSSRIEITNDVLPSVSNIVDLKGFTIGIPVEFHVDGLHDSALKAWGKTIQHLKDLGANVVSVSVPSVPHALPAYYVIASAEASSNLARYSGLFYGPRYETKSDEKINLEQLITKTRTEGFGLEVQRRLLCGTFVLSKSAYASYYEKGMLVRRQLEKEFENAFDQHGGIDVMLTPTAPTLPFPIHSPPPVAAEMYINDVMTVPVNLVGLPAISIPVTTTKMKIQETSIEVPIGMQFFAPRNEDKKVLYVAQAVERAIGFSLPERVFK